MSFSRRDFFVMGAAAAVSGTVVAGAGLTYREIRRRSWDIPADPAQAAKQIVNSDDWLLTYKDREQLLRNVDAESLRAGTMKRDPGADYVGSDLGRFEAINVDDCQAVCEATADCDGFAFATPEHPDPSKQNMCWLKTGSPSQVRKNQRGYISAQKLNR